MAKITKSVINILAGKFKRINLNVCWVDSNLSAFIILAIALLVAAVSTQEYGQRIGRRNRPNLGIQSVSSSPVITATKIESSVPVVPREARINIGYSYVPPTNPLLLPSSSNQEDHQVTIAVVPQSPEVVQQELEEDSLEIAQEITLPDPETFPVILADQNSLAPVQQQQPIDEEIAFWDFRESIPGEPEFDYPILDKIPSTSFKCAGQRNGNCSPSCTQWKNVPTMQFRGVKLQPIIDGYTLVMPTGYYADVETRCQVFHVCTNIPDAESIKASFLCPNGTIFNQEVFVCQW